VDKDGKKTIEVTKITYAGGTKSGDILQSDVPTFNNGLKLEGTLKLRVKKTVTGRAAEVAEGEFAFTVLNDGEAIKDQYGNALIFETENGGMVNISIPLTQDDIGDHDYVIKEVVPTTEDPSISYDASPVIASVTIGEVSGANGASVAAITDVTYTADQTEDGVPLMVNKYVASGSLKLQGTKKFLYGTQEQAISEGQFNFVVMEGNTQVATGTTKSGYQDNIEFTEINYVAADIGKHTYTISEVDDGQMFVEYTDKVVTVNVEVKDAGDGKLEAVATYEGDTDDKDISGHALFVNTCTFIIPSGIRLDVLPYVLIVLLALGCGALLLRRRKHMRG
jgi:pilin isopeptide linkage protein